MGFGKGLVVVVVGTCSCLILCVVCRTSRSSTKDVCFVLLALRVCRVVVGGVYTIFV